MMKRGLIIRVYFISLGGAVGDRPQRALAGL